MDETETPDLLTFRERSIAVQRWGENKPRTVVGRDMHMTPERVRQIEQHIILKLLRDRGIIH